MATTYTKIGDILSAFWKRAKKVVDAGDAETLEAAKAYAKDYADTEIASSVATAIQTNVTSKLGVANGFATLDENGQIPASQLTISAMEFKGNWDASQNAPALVDGTGNSGDFYVVSVAGTQGGVEYYVNDNVIYDGSHWVRLQGGTVMKVNGKSGTIVLDGTDINYSDDASYTITAADVTALASADKEVTVNGKNYTIKKGTYTDGQVVVLSTAKTINEKVDSLASDMELIAEKSISIDLDEIDAMIGTVTSKDSDDNEIITYVPDEIVASVVE